MWKRWFYRNSMLQSQSQLQLYLPICLVDNGLDTYDFKHLYSIRAIRHVSVVFFCVNTSTHYQVFCWQNGCLFIFVSANNQHKMANWSYVWKYAKYMKMAWPCLGSMVMCTVYTNNPPLVTWSLDWAYNVMLFVRPM